MNRAAIVRPGPDEIGGVSLLPADEAIQGIIDAQAAALDTIYCGIGRNDRTLEISSADLIGVAHVRVFP